jgi:hypothetical protein
MEKEWTAWRSDCSKVPHPPGVKWRLKLRAALPLPGAHLLLGHLEGDGLVHMLPGDATPASAVVHNGQLRADVLVVEDVAMVADHGAAGQLAHSPSGARAYHLAVDSHTLTGQGSRGFPGGASSAAKATNTSSSLWMPASAAGSLGAWCLRGPWPWQQAQQPLLLEQGLVGHEPLVLSAPVLVLPPNHIIGIHGGAGWALSGLGGFPQHHARWPTAVGRGILAGRLPLERGHTGRVREEGTRPPQHQDWRSSYPPESQTSPSSLRTAPGVHTTCQSPAKCCVESPPPQRPTRSL